MTEESSIQPSHTVPNLPWKRTEGGQPGNTNALKHGFYSHRFRERELKYLQDLPSDQDLQDEFDLLRVLICRVFEAVDDQDGGDLKDLTRALATCDSAVGRLGHILRIRAFLGGGSNELINSINQAIDEVASQFVKVNYG